MEQLPAMKYEGAVSRPTYGVVRMALSHHLDCDHDETLKDFHYAVNAPSGTYIPPRTYLILTRHCGARSRIMTPTVPSFVV
jgi:hypothetical protein